MLNHAFGLLVHPRKQWQSLQALPDKSLKRLSPFAIWCAMLPALAWYLGTTEFGWRIGDGEAIRMADHSALSMMGGFYFSLLIAVIAIGYFIHWMSRTYGVKSDPLKGYVFASYVATPIFLAGIAGIYPHIWVMVLLSLVAVSYAVYLLYVGLPIMFNLSEERGFLFASAVLAVSLVVGVSMMGGMVIFWDMVAHPEFV
ncbi:Yip1 family protein [Simiduia agarivorans]|uniref:Membrane protein n=1 Tax=Simiduia agarivorans (strain DSM 21679 / JCM 13881 / BCRC 17597 / SA1) TaxID=1117647 RepID=K4KL56_SIMAS|nr:Yip1 family protein [Simiduia agarivorans]AFU98783.1 membrane protein [Simiduia agarivorans SA1 = DSM 21679]